MKIDIFCHILPQAYFDRRRRWRDAARTRRSACGIPVLLQPGSCTLKLEATGIGARARSATVGREVTFAVSEACAVPNHLLKPES